MLIPLRKLMSPKSHVTVHFGNFHNFTIYILPFNVKVNQSIILRTLYRNCEIIEGKYSSFYE